MNIEELAPEIQRRVSGYWRGLPVDRFSRPERKFIGEMLLGLLKEPGIYVTDVARSRGEEMKLKKTWERLNRNLRREGLWERVLEVNILQQARRGRQMRYCVIDVSDIQKSEATQIEGLSLVRDGDKSSRDNPVIGQGFHWLNAVMADKEGVLPVYSELYSMELEERSENWRIVEITKKVGGVHPEVIFVLDCLGCSYPRHGPGINPRSVSPQTSEYHSHLLHNTASDAPAGPAAIDSPLANAPIIPRASNSGSNAPKSSLTSFPHQVTAPHRSHISPAPSTIPATSPR